MRETKGRQVKEQWYIGKERVIRVVGSRTIEV